MNLAFTIKIAFSDGEHIDRISRYADRRCSICFFFIFVTTALSLFKSAIISFGGNPFGVISVLFQDNQKCSVCQNKVVHDQLCQLQLTVHSHHQLQLPIHHMSDGSRVQRDFPQRDCPHRDSYAISNNGRRAVHHRTKLQHTAKGVLKERGRFEASGSHKIFSDVSHSKHLYPRFLYCI